MTLVLMGVGTTLVGLLPTHASIGIAAPILLLILRILQGIAVGGEWGGAVLMAVENAPEKYKAVYGAFPQLGNPMGALLASGIFALLTWGGTGFFDSGGWRIPFLLSAVLVGVGFWVRYTVEETPDFEAQQAEADKKELEPSLKETIRENWHSIPLGIGLVPISTGGYYIVTTFATAYGTEASFDVNISEGDLLTILTVASFFELISTLFIGMAADRIGRKRTMSGALVLSAIMVIPMFLTMGPDNLLTMFILFTVVRVLLNGTWAPLASILSQMFKARARQTSLSVTYTVGVAIWAGLSPIIATGLYSLTDTIWSVIGLFAAMTLLSLFCLAAAPEYHDRDVFAHETVSPEDSDVDDSAAPVGA